MVFPRAVSWTVALHVRSAAVSLSKRSASRGMTPPLFAARSTKCLCRSFVSSAATPNALNTIPRNPRRVRISQSCCFAPTGAHPPPHYLRRTIMTQQHPDPIPEDVLNKLFPAPRLSLVAPFPGATVQATNSLVALLKENHNKWHIFFNDSGEYLCAYTAGDFTNVPFPQAFTIIWPITCLQYTLWAPPQRSFKQHMMHTQATKHLASRVPIPSPPIHGRNTLVN